MEKGKYSVHRDLKRFNIIFFFIHIILFVWCRHKGSSYETPRKKIWNLNFVTDSKKY